MVSNCNKLGCLNATNPHKEGQFIDRGKKEMKVHHVEPVHIEQLKAFQKSFGVIYFPSWMQRKRQKVIPNLLSSIQNAIVLQELLQISVDSTDEVLNYLINDIKVASLPYFQFFFEGKLTLSFETSSVLSEISNPTFFYAPKSIPTIYEQALKSNIDVVQMLLREQSVMYARPLKLFISGDRSSVGKSSTCLALIATLVEEGVLPYDIAYIKPVTQCESEQAITRYCNEMQISHRGIGPVVFYQGFTRAYLAGETEPAQILIQKAVTSVNEIGMNKKIVIVDGVGYPAVGSICNISNGHVAQALQAPVLLIGKSGVGDAIDSYNLNAAFFEQFGVHVLGGIFNKFELTGFYNLHACKDSISSYFRQFKPHQSPYGFLPKLSAEEMEKNEAIIEESDRMITDDESQR